MKVSSGKRRRISQGDIYRNVEFIEYIAEEEGKIEVPIITFPLVIVLTQECDLEQDFKFRHGRPRKGTQDKYLISVLVSPLYNLEHVLAGEHLSELNLKMEPIKRDRTPGDYLLKNERARYHYIDFPPDIPIPPSVIDFKHYFTVNVEYLRTHKSDFVCRINPVYREDISQRFASFLSRIGIP
jgi:hypothetical protein